MIKRVKTMASVDTVKHFLYVFTAKTLAITTIAILATYACSQYDIIAESMPTSLIGLVVVFPIIFNINAAFVRRDQALYLLGELKSQLKSIQYAHTYWNGTKPSLEKLNAVLFTLLAKIKLDLADSTSPLENKNEIFYEFEKITQINEEMRSANLTPADLSRANQWLTQAMANYEKLSAISDYRTPKALRAYSEVFLSFFPILFSPYFASLNIENPYLGYIVAAVYTSVLVMLSNVQSNIENPFDRAGLDDIDLDREFRVF